MNSNVIRDITCPACRSARICRAEYDGILEHTILRILAICPFMCQACEMRFYMYLVSSPASRPDRPQTWLDAEQCKVTVSPN
jgi:hypothetical protein